MAGITGGTLLKVEDFEGDGFVTITLTPELAAAIKAAKAPEPPGPTETEILSAAKAERERIKAVNLKRIDARRQELIDKGLMKEGETLEQYDDRAIKEGLEPSFKVRKVAHG